MMDALDDLDIIIVLITSVVSVIREVEDAISNGVEGRISSIILSLLPILHVYLNDDDDTDDVNTLFQSKVMFFEYDEYHFNVEFKYDNTEDAT
jgi:hypothetical protein